MISIKSQKEIALLREGGRRLAAILNEVKKSLRPGMETRELDELAEALIIAAGGRPSFKGYKSSSSQAPYPAALCVSVNNEVVHGIPSEKIIRDGDVIGLDIGMNYGGFFTDMAETVVVGGGDAISKKLVRVTKEALQAGISKARAGARVGDIGEAIQQFVEKEGFGVVRELVGHGVGYKVHEDPEIPNWGRKGTGPELKENMVIAIEPMITEGRPEVYLDADGWTWKTKDGKQAAHFEHTVAVTEKGAEILTSLN